MNRNVGTKNTNTLRLKLCNGRSQVFGLLTMHVESAFWESPYAAISVVPSFRGTQSNISNRFIEILFDNRMRIYFLKIICSCVLK